MYCGRFFHSESRCYVCAYTTQMHIFQLFIFYTILNAIFLHFFTLYSGLAHCFRVEQSKQAFHLTQKPALRKMVLVFERLTSITLFNAISFCAACSCRRRAGCAWHPPLSALLPPPVYASSCFSDQTLATHAFHEQQDVARR